MEIQRLKNLYLNKILKHINKVNNELKLYNQCKEQTGGSLRYDDDDDDDDDNIHQNLLKNFKNKVNTLTKTNETQDQKILELSSVILNIKQEIQEKEVIIKQTYQELVDARRNLIIATEKLKLVKNQLRIAKQELSELQTTSSGNLNNIQTKIQEVTTLETTLANLRNTVDDLRNTVDDLQKEIANLQEEVKTLQKANTDLRSEISNKDENINRLGEQIKSINEQHVNILRDSITHSFGNLNTLIDNANAYINVKINTINSNIRDINIINENTTIELINKSVYIIPLNNDPDLRYYITTVDIAMLTNNYEELQQKYNTLIVEIQRKFDVVTDISNNIKKELKQAQRNAEQLLSV